MYFTPIGNNRNMDFTQDEILILKQLAERHATAAPVVDNMDVLEAIQNAPDEKDIRNKYRPYRTARPVLRSAPYKEIELPADSNPGRAKQI